MYQTRIDKINQYLFNLNLLTFDSDYLRKLKQEYTAELRRLQKLQWKEIHHV